MCRGTACVSDAVIISNPLSNRRRTVPERRPAENFTAFRGSTLFVSGMCLCPACVRVRHVFVSGGSGTSCTLIFTAPALHVDFCSPRQDSPPPVVGLVGGCPMTLALSESHTEPYASGSRFVQMRTDASPEADAYGSPSESPEAGAYGSPSARHWVDASQLLSDEPQSYRSLPLPDEPTSFPHCSQQNGRA